MRDSSCFFAPSAQFYVSGNQVSARLIGSFTSVLMILGMIAGRQAKLERRSSNKPAASAKRKQANLYSLRLEYKSIFSRSRHSKFQVVWNKAGRCAVSWIQDRVIKNRGAASQRRKTVN